MAENHKKVIHKLGDILLPSSNPNAHIPLTLPKQMEVAPSLGLHAKIGVY